jgi:hypothetical protein
MTKTQKKPAPSLERPWKPEDGVAFADHLLLTPRQTAKWLGTTEGALAVERCKRRGPAFIRVGRRRIMYLKRDVVAYLTARRVELQPPAA